MPRKPLLIAALTATLCGTAHAATALSQLRYTPDITVTLSGTTVGPADVAGDDLAGTVALVLPALPANVAAYHYTGSEHWLVFDTTVALPGGITATPRDIVAWDGSGFTPLFYAVVPEGVAIDALSTLTGSDYLLSFDSTVTVDSAIAEPGDVVLFDGAGAWSSHFSAASAGVPGSANLDALHRLPNGHLLVSFDVSGSVGGVAFDDEDVLEFTPGASTWEMAYDGSASDANWGAADLQALWAQAAPVTPGVLEFSASIYTVAENGVSATITVTRSGGASGAVSVSYASADGSAVQPGDYAPVSGALNWADGDAGPKTFTVTIADDALAEESETLALALSAPTGGATLGANAAATLTITDDDVAPGAPVAQAAPGALAFGSRSVATTSAPATLSVTNAGDASLIIGSVTLTGTNAGDFALSGDTCTGATLAPLASCTVAATFTPGAAGARAASLAIASNDAAGPLAVALNGTGVAAAATPGSNVTGIPTLSEWGLVLLSVLLAGLGVRRPV